MTEARQVQDYIRWAAARHRDVVRVPGFTCTIDPHDDLRFVNYAIPDGDPADPAAIRPVYAGRGRLPRLEHVEEAAPWLEARLLAAGFREESRLRLMVCTPQTWRAIAPPEGVALEPVGDAAALLTVQRAAFGHDRPVTAEDAARWRGIAILARAGTVPAGAANLSTPHDGLTEVAGVAVAEAYRRRGIAAALVSEITRRAFDEHGAALAFLTPGDEDSARVYARAGFQPRLTALAFSD